MLVQKKSLITNSAATPKPVATSSAPSNLSSDFASKVATDKVSTGKVSTGKVSPGKVSPAKSAPAR